MLPVTGAESKPGRPNEPGEPTGLRMLQHLPPAMRKSRSTERLVNSSCPGNFFPEQQREQSLAVFLTLVDLASVVLFRGERMILSGEYPG